MSFSMTKIILLTIFLAAFANSSLIYENWPDTLFLENYKREIQDVQVYKSISKIDMGVFYYTNGSSSISLKGIKQEFNYIEVNNLSFEYDKNCFILKGPERSFLLKYSFSFNTSKGKSSSGLFSLYSNEFSISKSYELVNNQTVLQAKAEVNKLSFFTDAVSFEGDKDKEMSSLVQGALNSLTLNHTDDFIQAFNTDLAQYYSSLSDNKTLISFNSKDPQLEFKLDLTYDRLPQRFGNSSVIFYHSGNINDHVNKHKEMSSMKKDVYQILINKGVFLDFFTDLTKEGMLDVTLTQKNKPLNTPFNLNIQSLGNIIPQIREEYSRSDDIKVWSVVSDIQMNDDNNGLSGQFVLNSEVYHSSDMKQILSFKSTFSFDVKFSINLEDLRCNFYLDNYSVNILNVKVLSPSTFSPVYLNTLKRWVELALRSHLEQNNYYLLEKPFNLKTYFRNVTEAYPTEDGFMIAGSPKGVVSFAAVPITTQEIAKDEKNNLKFLFKLN